VAQTGLVLFCRPTRNTVGTEGDTKVVRWRAIATTIVERVILRIGSFVAWSTRRFSANATSLTCTPARLPQRSGLFSVGILVTLDPR
jgi:hypothetical protein